MHGQYVSLPMARCLRAYKVTLMCSLYIFVRYVSLLLMRFFRIYKATCY